MAENAANFTFTLQNKPSIFEIIAQKSLNDTLHPALQKVALFLSTNSPKKFYWLNKYYEETFLVLNALLQYHYLKVYDGSFSENFYGLKRVIAKNNNKLTEHHKRISLLFLCVLPFLKRKLEEKLALYRIENSEGSLKKDFEGRFKKFLLVLHSTFEVTWSIISLANYLKYMSSSTESQLPGLKIINIKLTYLDEPPINPGFWTALFKGQLGVSELSFGLIRNGVTSALEVTAFFLQFLQTWNAERSNYNITALPNVQPPPFDQKAVRYSGKCPICLKSWKIPTVLPVSGYIFCFRCIMRQLNDHQKCPITNLPAKPLDIVRLFDT